MPAQSAQVYSIESFTPGIRQVPSPSHPPGTAVESGTHRCVAFVDGVLRGAPRLVDSIAASSTLAITPTTSRVSSEYRIGGLYANDPVYSTAGGNATVAGKDQCNTELWLGMEFWDENASPWHRRVFRYHRHRTTPSWTLMASSNAAGTYNANSRPKRCVFFSGRSNTNASSATVGPVVVGWVYAEWAYFSPDPSSPTSDSTKIFPADTANYPPNYGLAYQNRAVIFPLTSLGANANTVHPDNEAFYWTNVNDWQTRDDLLTAYSNTVAYVENSHGYEFAVPLAADRLLLMKRAEGGVVLQGDLNFFAADPRPGLVSPGLSLGGYTHSQIGVLYPVNAGGVYVIEGDASRCVSDYMESNFWRPDALNPANGSQSANGWGWSECNPCRVQNFAAFPHNWLFDCDTGAWWRFEPATAPKDYHWLTADWTQRWFWAAPSGYEDADSEVIHEYDMTLEAEDYSWTSQPLAFSLNQRVRVDEVIVWAHADNTNTSTVAVTVTSSEDPTGRAQTYTIPSSVPRAIRQQSRFGVTGTGIQIKLEADGNSSGVAAPKIHRVDVLFHVEGDIIQTA